MYKLNENTYINIKLHAHICTLTHHQYIVFAMHLTFLLKTKVGTLFEKSSVIELSHKVNTLDASMKFLLAQANVPPGIFYP